MVRVAALTAQAEHADVGDGTYGHGCLHGRLGLGSGMALPDPYQDQWSMPCTHQRHAYASAPGTALLHGIHTRTVARPSPCGTSWHLNRRSISTRGQIASNVFAPRGAATWDILSKQTKSRRSVSSSITWYNCMLIVVLFKNNRL